MGRKVLFGSEEKAETLEEDRCIAHSNGYPTTSQAVRMHSPDTE